MAHVHLVFDRSLPASYSDPFPQSRLPYRLAVPLVLAASAGLWVGIWKLGSLVIGLIG